MGKILWKRKWQPTLVLAWEIPRLVDYSPQGRPRVGHNLATKRWQQRTKKCLAPQRPSEHTTLTARLARSLSSDPSPIITIAPFHSCFCSRHHHYICVLEDLPEFQVHPIWVLLYQLVLWPEWALLIPSFPLHPWVGKIPWRRERLPTPVFWLREFYGVYSPWGHKESDTTEWLSLSLSFLARSNHLLISRLQSPSSVILERKERKSAVASTFPLPFAMKSWDQMSWSWLFSIFSFNICSFTPPHHPLKRLFSSSWLSAIRVIASTCLRLLMFLLPILILACNSSSLAFLMMCLQYRLNKQGDSKQPCHIPFFILNQSFVPYRVLTVASWPAYRFLKRGKMVWYSHLFKNFPQFVMIHTD